MDALAQRLAVMQRVHAGWGAETKGNQDLGSLCRFLEEQAARGQLPADPMAPLAARGARGGTRTRSDESRRRSGAAAASKSLASKSVAAASLRFLQSGWNSPSTR
jgi:hypothetical protein